MSQLVGAYDNKAQDELTKVKAEYREAFIPSVT